jgi:transposase
VVRKYGVNTNQLFHWRKPMREEALVAVGADENIVPASESNNSRPCLEARMSSG